MRLPDGVGDTISFHCNICGAANALPASAFHREAARCCSCGSVARFRGLVNALSNAIFGTRYNLTAMPRSKSIRGIGMSDSEIYAKGLSKVLDYTNTFYHTEPRLDVTDVDFDRYHDLDFMISSDVFEHIPLPLEPAFRNMRAMLKPGGSLIFSVPYSSATCTLERFPNIHEFKLVEFTPGEWILVNRTVDRRWEVHEGLIFHGGPGVTVEMRLFSERDLLDQLCAAGFAIETIYSEPLLDITGRPCLNASRTSESRFSHTSSQHAPSDRPRRGHRFSSTAAGIRGASDGRP
jgi:SAM-dependent methyltransferase